MAIIASVFFLISPFAVKLSNSHFIKVQSTIAILFHVLSIFRVIQTGGYTSTLILAPIFISFFTLFFINSKISLLLSILTIFEVIGMFFIKKFNIISFDYIPSPNVQFSAAIFILTLMATIFFIEHHERIYLKELSKKYEKKDKLVQFGQVSAGISHELNNYLSIIGINSQVIEAHFVDAKPFTDKINHSITRIEETVNALRYIHNKDFHKSLKDLNVLDIIKKLKSSYPIEISSEIQEAIVKANGILIFKVFENLLRNSECALEHLPEKWIKITVSDDNDFINVSFTDSGNGIPKEYHEKIFHSFFTTKDINQGSGIGLDLCKVIMQKHQGEITLNPDSVNTEFSIKLLKS